MLLQEEVCDTVEEEKCETEYMTKYEQVKTITAALLISGKMNKYMAKYKTCQGIEYRS